MNDSSMPPFALRTPTLKGVFAILLLFNIFISADAQRTQLGNGPLNLSVPFGVDNPLYYVDTLNNSYWKRDGKKQEFYFVAKTKDVIVVHDTVYVNSGKRDTIWLTRKSYSPTDYGALRQNKTLAQAGLTQAQINTMFPGTGATVNDQVDWAAWQLCVNEAISKGASVFPAQGNYYINRSINLGKRGDVFMTMDGAYAKLITTNTDSFSVFMRPRPADMTEANLMVSSVINVERFIFKLSSRQTAIELNCLYGGSIIGNWAWNGQELIHMRFCMGMRITHNYAQFTRFLGTAENGDWPGATPSNSQCNADTWESNHHACTDPKGITYRIYGSSDNAIRYDTVRHTIIDGISEQLTAKHFIDFDGRGFGGNFNLYVQNCHIEYNNGFTDCAIKIRCMGGIFVLDGVNFPGPGSVFVDAYSSGGLGSLRIMNIFDYDAPANGILFRNNGFSWDFQHNQFILGNMNIPSKFQSGGSYVVPQPCDKPPACGYNRYKITDIPR